MRSISQREAGLSLYSPEVRREANLFGITELQAYRKLRARSTILRNRQELARLEGLRHDK